jgi:hypothetical protein
MSTNPQTTIPGAISQASSEDITWPVDCSNLVGAGQALGTVTVELVALASANAPSTVVALDAPTVNGTLLSQRIPAGTLTANVRYTLTWMVGIANSTNIFAVQTNLYCPF